MTDRNVRETLAICDRAYILVDGRVIAHRIARRAIGRRSVRRTYLGVGFRLALERTVHRSETPPLQGTGQLRIDPLKDLGRVLGIVCC